MPASAPTWRSAPFSSGSSNPATRSKRGDIVAVVDTEKATIEVEVFETGVIQKIIVPEGEKVPVGTLLALIGADGEVAAPTAEVKPKPIAAAVPIKEKPTPAVLPPPAPAAPPRCGHLRRGNEAAGNGGARRASSPAHVSAGDAYRQST